MQSQTISEAIGSDHKTIDSYAENIKTATSLEDKIKWRNQFTWALARHAISEELIMYPAMEKHMGQEGLDLTNVDREQHQAVGLQRPRRSSSSLIISFYRSKKTFTNSNPCPHPPPNSRPSLIAF